MALGLPMKIEIGLYFSLMFEGRQSGLIWVAIVGADKNKRRESLDRRRSAEKSACASGGQENLAFSRRRHRCRAVSIGVV